MKQKRAETVFVDNLALTRREMMRWKLGGGYTRAFHYGTASSTVLERPRVVVWPLLAEVPIARERVRQANKAADKRCW